MTVEEIWGEYNHKCLAKYFDDIRFELNRYISKTEKMDKLNKKAKIITTNKNSSINSSTTAAAETVSSTITQSDNDNFLQYIDSEKSQSEQERSGYSSAIDRLVLLFGLSKFEKFILLLCAAIELDSEISVLCKKILIISSRPASTDHYDTDNSGYVTFGLVLAIVPQIAHWSALAPISPLRNYKLIETYGYPQTTITNSILRINERVLHYLIGISYIDRDLLNVVKHVPVEIIDTVMVPSHGVICKNLLSILSSENKMERAYQLESGEGLGITEARRRGFPIIQLFGNDETSKINIAKWICRKIGLTLWKMEGVDIPLKADEMNTFISIWKRESVLLRSALYISFNDSSLESATQKALKRFVSADGFRGIFFVSTIDQWNFDGYFVNSFDVKKPLKHEQFEIWKSLLGEVFCTTYSNELSNIINQFDLNVTSIISATHDALVSTSASIGAAAGRTTLSETNNEKNNSAYKSKENKSQDTELDSPMKNDFNYNHQINNVSYQKKLIVELWKSSIKASRPNVGELAQQIMPVAKMADIVLPERERHLLRDIAVHVKLRTKVFQEWGFNESAIGVRGLALSALFSGDSGTGKTMAAEALANELELELFRIDLSMVVNKYIGETEKNLRRVFDAAEGGGVILFFDEADALFGKRSEVTSSHDRYANIEVGYLLQRMETYKGLVILATNMKNALDSAFVRRINFIVNFPFPDENSRAEMWKRIFPHSVKTENLDAARLAKLNISGGNIRNIALHASFLAAEVNLPVNMNLIKRAAQIEYDKLGRQLTRHEVGDW